MPILVTGNNSEYVDTISPDKENQSGLTFIEVMVVVLILGLMASVVILNIPRDKDYAKEDAFRFAARLKSAQEMAIMRGQFIGLDVDEGTYKFVAYENGEWVTTLLPGGRSGQEVLSEEVIIHLDTEDRVKESTAGGDRGFFTPEKQEDKEKKISPEARFEPTGEVEPFALNFIGKEQVWQVNLDLQADISVGVIDE